MKKSSLILAYSLIYKITCVVSLSLLSCSISAQSLFDSHVHYDRDDAMDYSPKDIISYLDKNDVRYAAVTGSPVDLIVDLHRHAPDHFIPLLGIYTEQSDKNNWVEDDSIPSNVETELKRGIWRGIGEIHIFAADRFSPVFTRIVEIASEHDLPLLIHGDPAVIDTIYTIAPEQKVVWAHAGKYPYPDLITDYLQRYAELSVDLTMRDERIAPDGDITDAWYELFITHPDRFMVGVDTYSTARWREYDSAVSTIRAWLSQLPEGVRGKLAYDNAAVIYRVPPKGHSLR